MNNELTQETYFNTPNNIINTTLKNLSGKEALIAIGILTTATFSTLCIALANNYNIKIGNISFTKSNLPTIDIA